MGGMSNDILFCRGSKEAIVNERKETRTERMAKLSCVKNKVVNCLNQPI